MTSPMPPTTPQTSQPQNHVSHPRANAPPPPSTNKVAPGPFDVAKHPLPPRCKDYRD
ncbi:hypothetical protein GQ44DRAFT_712564, partial [Phaeosphaeriaceae sp. PMI808]